MVNMVQTGFWMLSMMARNEHKHTHLCGQISNQASIVTDNVCIRYSEDKINFQLNLRKDNKNR